jgi:hypothetical protein
MNSLKITDDKSFAKRRYLMALKAVEKELLAFSLKHKRILLHRYKEAMVVSLMINSAIEEFGPELRSSAILHLMPAITKLSIWKDIKTDADWDSPIDDLEGSKLAN